MPQAFCTKQDLLLLVDSHDKPLGAMPKDVVHRDGILHRAFSIFIYNNEGEVLLQKRADTKYHSAGLWANSCCGHPTAHFPVNQDIVAYEDIAVAATRRLFEELGLRTKLRQTIEISYNLLLENGLYENEYVHIFVGRYDGMTAIVPNIDEVSEIRCLTPEAIRQDVHENSDQYAAWFRLYVMEYYENIFALSMHWH